MKKKFTLLLMLCFIGITSAWAEDITTTFKACAPYSDGMTLECENGGLSWVTSKAPTAFETNDLSRGLSWSKVSTNLTSTIDGATVSKVVIVASTNGTSNLNSIGVTVGDVQLGSVVNMPKENNRVYTFTGSSLMGEIKIALTSGGENGKSIWIKSITVTYTNDATPKYTVTYSAGENGSVTAKVDGVAINSGDEVTNGKQVVFTATGNAGFKFSKWNDNSTENPRTITINGEDINISATFEASNEVVLTFDFTSEIDGWAHKKTDATAGNFTYTLDEVDYIFNLSKNGADGIYQTSYTENEIKYIYLMLNKGENLGLPAISGYKLTKVVAANTSSCSKSTKVSITDGSNAVSGGEGQTWANTSSTYTYELTGTYPNSMYYVSVSSKNAQIQTLTLTYEKDESAQGVNITSAGWATAYIPFKATVTGATAYKVSVDGENNLTKTELSVIPANTGVLLKGNEGIAVFTPSDAEASDVTGNMMVGTTAVGGQDFEDLGYTYYVLGNGSKGVGFYWDYKNYNDLEGLGAHCDQYKAVLRIPDSSAKVEGFSLEDEATGINAVDNSQCTMQNSQLYNLQGVRVNDSYKGIIIVNGKKYLNK